MRAALLHANRGPCSLSRNLRPSCRSLSDREQRLQQRRQRAEELIKRQEKLQAEEERVRALEEEAIQVRLWLPLQWLRVQRATDREVGSSNPTDQRI